MMGLRHLYIRGNKGEGKLSRRWPVSTSEMEQTAISKRQIDEQMDNTGGTGA